MKFKMMSLVLATGLFFSCTTTRTTTSDNAAYNVQVPVGVKQNFSFNYPDATNVVWNQYDAATVPIDWELTGWTAMDANDFAVTFDMGAYKYTAWYDSNGQLVGSTYAVSDFSKLPYAITRLLQDKYKDYMIESAQREMWGSHSAYELKLSKGDSKVKLVVDNNGTVLKEKM